MSILETPRIYFRGQIAWDPITTNNYPQLYDETSGEVELPPAATTRERVDEYRAEAIAAVRPDPAKKVQRSWDPHGTHRSTFFDTCVSGADLGGGLVTDDPFVNGPASFTGMLVDLEPYGAYTSQLFFDGMKFGVDGGYRIALPRMTRFTDRYINFARNAVGYITGPFSVLWQASFAKSDPGFAIDPFDSPALNALAEAVFGDPDVLGLTVRWDAYRTIYYDCAALANDEALRLELADQLIAQLDGGGFQPNPARSMIVGTIGLWRRGEPAHEPGDRALLTVPNSPVASAQARLDGDRLVLDLSNSVPETGLDLEKQNLGQITVWAVDGGGGATAIGSFNYPDYDRDAYDASSGIVTVPLAAGGAALAAGAGLELRQSNGTVLLTETALRAIPLVPNLYLDQGQSAALGFQLYDRGAPAGAGISVTVCLMSADGDSIASQFSLVSDGNGRIAFSFSGTAAGISAYVPVPGPNPALPTQGLDTQLNTYMYVRVLPADAQTAVLPPTWDNVYTAVLANWNALAPCMDNWLDLASEAQVRAYGPLLRRLTDPGAFESYRFMPVTRDMTVGERTLLYNFLDAGAGPAAEAFKAAPPAEPKSELTRLSRFSRSG